MEGNLMKTQSKQENIVDTCEREGIVGPHFFFNICLIRLDGGEEISFLAASQTFT